MSGDDLPRPTEGDVIALILDDHRVFEDLMRGLRDRSADRAQVLATFSELHVAHALAEESEVYPGLERREAITDHEAEHGEEEHAEAHEALLDVLRLEELYDDHADELLEALSTAVNHHLAEEELTILNPAREDVAEATRAELGARFAEKRNALLDQGCGDADNVARIVDRAEDQGLLDDD